MNSGKAIFVGNIKGGVGKSTLAVYLTDYLRARYERRPVMLLDTDPQGTAFEMMRPLSRADDIKFLPIGDRYDGVSMTTLDGILRRMLSEEDSVTIVDRGRQTGQCLADGNAVQHRAGADFNVLDGFASDNRFH